MSRELKFRIWDEEKKEMVGFIKIEDCQTLFRICNLNDQNSCKCKIVQFTGLYDIENKEIYEGDILEQRSKNGNCRLKVVNFESFECGCFCGGNWFGMGFVIDEMQADKIKIIGNIYENPELLEVKDE